MVIDLPNELAQRLNPLREQLPQILERGLRKINSENPVQFAELADVFEFLAGLPSPAEIVAMRPSAELQQRISDLLEKNRLQGFSAAEEAEFFDFVINCPEWQQIEYLEHLVRMAKARAYQKLQQPS